MSSWLRRIAACYQMDIRALLEHDLGHGHVDDLDIAPPLSFLSHLAQRSGIEQDRLNCMSLAGLVPWLLDSIDDSIPFSLETYVFQFSVLLPRNRRKTRSISNWRAWIPNKPVNRACPVCLHDLNNQALLFAWKLPLMLSCPVHGCWLESYWGIPGEIFRWTNTDSLPRMARKTISAMDCRTWQALMKGHVELPRRRIHAGLWFRLLRTLLDELNTPLSQCEPCGKTISYIWKHCGHPVRAGQHFWRPFEILERPVQLQMLEAAATAIDLIESKEVSPRGDQAELFLPEPQIGFTNDQPADNQDKESTDSWQKMVKAIQEEIAEAKHNPEVARSLFSVASYGRRDPDFLENLRTTFIESGIPPEFLSH